MLARLSIVAGLVLGVAAAGLLLGGLFALAPEAPPPSLAAPSVAPASVAPSVVASQVPAPSPVASQTPAPSAGPSSAAADAFFRAGEPASPLVVPQADGGTVMPGVDVTP